MAFLKNGDWVVVDTHIIVTAARQRQAATAGMERTLLEEICRRCPRIFVTRKQSDVGRSRASL